MPGEWFRLVTIFILELRCLQGSLDMVPSPIEGATAVHSMVHLVKKCLLEKHKTIAIAGAAYETAVEDLHRSENTAITYMADTRSTAYDPYILTLHDRVELQSGKLYKFQRKVWGFVVSASSQPILGHLLHKLKNSRWWNSYAYFIIMRENSEEDDCKQAYDYLITAWRHKLLRSLFLCRDGQDKLTMYSYNPYSDYASKDWRKVGEYAGRYGHPWTLFKLNTNVDQSTIVCKDMFYDKTRQLNGYRIRINATPVSGSSLFINANKTGIEKYEGEDARLMRTLFRKLNAVSVDVPYSGKDSIGYADSKGVYRGMMGDIAYERADIGFNARYMVQFWKVAMTYPHNMLGICFVTKTRGNAPQWMNVWYIYDTPNMIGIFAVTTFTGIWLGYIKKRGYSSGFLEVLRMVVSTSLIRTPKSVPTRTFLATVLLLFLITNGTFQGRLVSLLTKPRAYDNVETMKDLKETGYMIHGYEPFRRFFDDPILRERFNSGNREHCVKRAIEGHPIACLENCLSLLNKCNKHTQLHLAKEKFLNYHYVYVATSDWPLLERMDVIIQRLVQAGFTMQWRKDVLADIDRNNWAKARATALPDHKVLSMEDIGIAFYALIFGLACATLSFGIELIIGRRQLLRSGTKLCE